MLAACTNEPTTSNEVQQEDEQQVDEQKPENDFDKEVKQKNEEFDLTPLELTSYSKEVGATLTQPTYAEFAVNEFVTIEGTVEQHEQLKEKYAWIKIQFSGVAVSDRSQEYYAPIVDGKFKQDITLYNGEGEYRVTVLLPSTDRDNYYYDVAKFNVYNVNPTIQRDITYSPFAQEAELTIIDPDSGYIKANGEFALTGKINTNDNQEVVMIELRKETESWKHMVPVKDGSFSYNVPLFYGKGVHQLKVYVPDNEKNDYFQDGTIFYIDNESDLVTDPITYTSTYEERGIHLDSPTHGGDETNLTYRIKGSIDSDAPFAKETTHLYITTKKDGEKALAVIPVNDYTFDDEFYLRFGPGTYEVTVSVPEIKEENSAKFYYHGVAIFSVENTAAEDERDLLPSRGVQSDSSEIITIANELMKDTMSDREKAKAVYEYTAKTISYDVEKLKNSEFEWDDSALKVLNLKTGICQDYAYLAIALLRAGGMEARYIAGTAGSGFNHARHAWVEVMVDGEWLTMDPTWGAGYVDKDTFVPNYTEDFFEPDEEAFKTHSRYGVEY